MATTYTVNVPGLFCKKSFNEDRVFVKAPIFKDPLGEECGLKNVAHLSVIADRLFFEESSRGNVFGRFVRRLFFSGDDALTEGTSIKEVRGLVERCQDVPIRELVVRRFPSTAIPRSPFAVIPVFTTFFNTVVLHYQNTDSFQEFLLALVDEEKLETLRLERPEENKIANHCKLETSRTLEVVGALPFYLMKSFGSTGEAHHEDSAPFAWRRFLMSHTDSTERILEVTVFTSNTEATETLSDEEFLEKANFSRIRFHFNRGNAMYWRTLYTTPITEKAPVPEPQGTQLQKGWTEDERLLVLGPCPATLPPQRQIAFVFSLYARHVLLLTSIYLFAESPLRTVKMALPIPKSGYSRFMKEGAQVSSMGKAKEVSLLVYSSTSKARTKPF
uniref:Uncharacterized protein n=1 Tax=Steinernema glaseri TaxID=37863 RepID=A0A1I7ZA96_9BILA